MMGMKIKNGVVSSLETSLVSLQNRMDKINSDIMELEAERDERLQRIEEKLISKANELAQIEKDFAETEAAITFLMERLEDAPPTSPDDGAPTPQ